jgi:hypothetical protein
MKKLIVSAAVVSLMTGCSTFNSKPDVNASPTPSVTKDQSVPAVGKLSSPDTIDLPSWYIKAPASTDDYVFIAGTGFSSDLAMSREKALLDGQLKLADKLNGMINAMIKQQKNDSAGTMGVDKTSMTIKKLITDTALTGYQIEDSRITVENRSYRTFVLIRYPLGDANRILKQRQQREDQLRETDDALQKELDQEMDRSRKPQKQSSVTPDLLPVDNAEYRQRREAALKKPDVVVEQLTVQ